jgi:ribonuclease HII
MRVPIDGGPVEVGVDESGRGSVISAVVAGAVVMPPLSTIPDDLKPLYATITDSKKLGAKKREELAQFIKTHAIAWGVGVVHETEIDSINILNATMKAMHIALDAVTSTCAVDALLVDGNRFKSYKNIPHECIVKGDATVLCIAAGSILAKTEHDKIIRELIASDPDTYTKYDLLKNMGYATPKHIKAIQTHGITPAHRKSFVIKSLS